MKRILSSLVMLLVVAAVSGLVFTACQDEGNPVQTPQEERQPTMLYKSAATTIATLNPAINPTGGCADWYSSGGKNAAPIWLYYDLDLSAYANHNVKIIFTFSTQDGLFNKYEGWYVDDIDIDGTLDDVESGAGAWTTSGYWHMSSARSNSPGHSWRYANPLTGNYQGSTINDDCSDSPNMGSLTSGLIGLGASPRLKFWTLWQIEAVNADGFDLMMVEVMDMGVIPVDLDIKPNGCPNPLNVKAGGTLPAAVLGSAMFDITQIDPTSVTLVGVPQGPQTPYVMDIAAPYGMPVGDCDDCTEAGPDGFTDVTYYFDNRSVAGALAPYADQDCKVVWLRGRLMNGLNFAGHDFVKILDKGK